VLQLLTDEQFSPAVARQAPGPYRGITIQAIQTWQGGHLLGASDEVVLREANKAKLTLVTFDLKTIPSLLRLWTEQGTDHAGVILVDEKTFAQNDIGGLIAGLCALWKVECDATWTNPVIYLRR
jgi:hypothetical protein